MKKKIKIPPNIILNDTIIRCFTTGMYCIPVLISSFCKNWLRSYLEAKL